MHDLAVHCSPPAHDPASGRQPISHVVFEHETSPPHEPPPLQQSVLPAAALETVPEHDGEPLHATLQVPVALQATFPLHACSSHAT